MVTSSACAITLGCAGGRRRGHGLGTRRVEGMATVRGLSRRSFLQIGLGVTGGSLLAACAPAAPAAKPTEAAKPAAPGATTAPAAAATTAPAAPAAAKPTEAAAAAKPAAPPAAASGKPEAKLGANLVGTVAGATIMPDAKRPPKLGEAPMLAELVKAGKLPPVEQRVPEEPLVVKPLNEIGKYGGMWRRAFTGPG